MPDTSRGFPFPADADAPDIPFDIEELANRINGEYSAGLLASRPAFGVVGRRYYATDVPAVYLDLGTSWITEVPSDVLRAADIGVTVQGYDATLAAFAGLTIAANKLVYGTGADAFATTDLTAAARSILDDATVGDMLTTLGFSTFIKTLIDDTDAAAARETLGVMAAPGSYAPRATPAFNTGYRPSTTRPTFVLATIEIGGNASNDDGAIKLLMDAASTPTTIISQLLEFNNAGASAVAVRIGAGFLVPANQYYLLDDVQIAGSCTFAITSIFELTL